MLTARGQFRRTSQGRATTSWAARASRSQTRASRRSSARIARRIAKQGLRRRIRPGLLIDDHEHRRAASATRKCSHSGSERSGRPDQSGHAALVSKASRDHQRHGLPPRPAPKDRRSANSRDYRRRSHAPQFQQRIEKRRMGFVRRKDMPEIFETLPRKPGAECLVEPEWARTQMNQSKRQSDCTSASRRKRAQLKRRPEPAKTNSGLWSLTGMSTASI